MQAQINVVGMVLAVEYRDEDGSFTTRDIDEPGQPYVEGLGVVMDEFLAMGYSVQSVSLHIDGAYRVEVRA